MRGLFIAENTGDQSHNCINQNHSCDRAIRQHIIADGNFLIDQMFHDSMIDAFVMPTDDDQMRFVLKVVSPTLDRKRRPAGDIKITFGFLLSIAFCSAFDVRHSAFGVSHLQIFHRRKNRFRLHHHPLPSTERAHHPPHDACRSSNRADYEFEIERAIFLRPFHHAFV